MQISSWIYKHQSKCPCGLDCPCGDYPTTSVCSNSSATTTKRGIHTRWNLGLYCRRRALEAMMVPLHFQ